MVDYKSLAVRYGLAVVWGFLYASGALSTLLTALTLFFSTALTSIFFTVSREGILLTIGDAQYLFVEACVATAAYFLWGVLVLTTKDAGKKARWLLAFGWVAIFIVNMVRIVGLIALDQVYGRALFDQVHLMLWYFVGSLYLVILWIVLSKKAGVKGIPLWSDIKTLILLANRKA